jgi:hypothetical protein
MTSPTPEDRLVTVERHAYTVNALADTLAGISQYAHLTDTPALGFLIGFIGDRLRQEAEAILQASATYNRRRDQL